MTHLLRTMASKFGSSLIVISGCPHKALNGEYNLCGKDRYKHVITEGAYLQLEHGKRTIRCKALTCSTFECTMNSTIDPALATWKDACSASVRTWTSPLHFSTRSVGDRSSNGLLANHAARPPAQTESISRHHYSSTGDRPGRHDPPAHNQNTAVLPDEALYLPSSTPDSNRAPPRPTQRADHTKFTTSSHLGEQPREGNGSTHRSKAGEAASGGARRVRKPASQNGKKEKAAVAQVMPAGTDAREAEQARLERDFEDRLAEFVQPGGQLPQPHFQQLAEAAGTTHQGQKSTNSRQNERRQRGRVAANARTNQQTVKETEEPHQRQNHSVAETRLRGQKQRKAQQAGQHKASQQAGQQVVQQADVGCQRQPRWAPARAKHEPAEGRDKQKVVGDRRRQTAAAKNAATARATEVPGSEGYGAATFKASACFGASPAGVYPGASKSPTMVEMLAERVIKEKQGQQMAYYKAHGEGTYVRYEARERTAREAQEVRARKEQRKDVQAKETAAVQDESESEEVRRWREDLAKGRADAEADDAWHKRETVKRQAARKAEEDRQREEREAAKRARHQGVFWEAHFSERKGEAVRECHETTLPKEGNTASTTPEPAASAGG
jgi:hypothetical protein